MSTPDRRRAVADVLLEIIATRGTDAVSVREVAAAAGVSIGAVQHHFATKAEMMAFAFDSAVERTRARLATLELSGDRRTDVATVMSELLPLDDTRQREAAVHLAFASLAATTPSLQAIQAALLADIRRELEDVLGTGNDDAATMLLATVDGLALHAVSAPGSLSNDRLQRALGAAIDAALARRG